MIRLRKVKLSDDTILNFLGKSGNYLKCLKDKVGNNFEKGYLLHNKKQIVYFIFPDGTMYNEKQVRLKTTEKYVNIAGEKRNFLELYDKTFEIPKKPKKIEIITTTPTDVILNSIFKKQGYLKIEITKDIFGDIRTSFKAIIYDNINKKQIDLSSRKTEKEAEEDKVNWYKQRLKELIHCKYTILTVKNKYFFLTKDGRVYNSYLLHLTVDEDGFVVMNKVKRKVENLIKEFIE